MLHQNWTKHIEQFSSTNLSHLYQNIPLSSTIISENLQLSDSYFTLVNCIGNVVGFINRYGGFNINSWYKILIIDDKLIGSVNNTNISYQNKNFTLHLKNVDSGELHFHTCYIHTMNFDILDRNQRIFRQKEIMIFDISILNN